MIQRCRKIGSCGKEVESVFSNLHAILFERENGKDSFPLACERRENTRKRVMTIDLEFSILERKIYKKVRRLVEYYKCNSSLGIFEIHLRNFECPTLEGGSKLTRGLVCLLAIGPHYQIPPNFYIHYYYSSHSPPVVSLI
ncbi:hypothetical protein ABFS83_11G071500 [Erythranthe nasuta]